MNDLKTQWTYDLGLVTGDEKVATILDTINNEICVYDTMIDIHDLDETTAFCSFEFNNINAEYDCKVINKIEDILKEMGIEYNLNNYPYFDECGTYYTYDIKIYFNN